MLIFAKTVLRVPNENTNFSLAMLRMPVFRGCSDIQLNKRSEPYFVYFAVKAKLGL